ncbi:hypothetical protein Xaut_1193 [Xanthobacter versatilis]|uniref:Uncharacterized protein n=1 Tax=Xanthobacter autotrophicus (strain ATCC BAA-1158 / Py2) TaxID=78245 RepID=A7IEJ9_XANP2|nr:hypothetical protein Xaut_1193 [Xanthobacter autotrophicus Py2]
MPDTSFKLNPTLEDDENHFGYLKKLEGPEQWAVKYLYDRLGIIDNKMSALLRLNGIIIGFLSLAVFRVAENSKIVTWPIIFLSMCVVVFVVLTYAEIMGARIFYLAFDRVTPSRTFDDYCKTAMNITITRERQYRQAFWASVGGIALFILMFMFVAVGDIYKLSTAGAEALPAACTPVTSCPPPPKPPA